MLSLLLSLSLAVTDESFVTPPNIASAAPVFHQLATQEYDVYLKHWQKGKELQLSHPLFRLSKVSAGPTSFPTILFDGEANGGTGQISMTFYNLEGDQIFSPPGTVQKARVDDRQRKFVVSAAIPRLLIGQTGAIQVTFTGENGKRAAFYVKAKF
ncbi:hypothetical protein [Brevibacillus nitrificans]|uniref:hypothetical protein n=1 Tax=Brevibacillus nitrificans TaxID=651560 RepID=UPI00285DF154|nr:hypothetical protein [Brevibacillus nitrificans]MDR7319304.1 hypothetical protein [Brevibacillus nitrificans]